ncbi:DUF202 domain-containing protein [Agromyces marinus]|uniref:DUF202 domain-containing protein n=1 Tax=Agromyces marinus TaxID=1389020 RepID=UPI001F2A516D|nr:DUF202 domain-containing protein [Agromyces marinus]UIP59168.1 hypothetical protein DSM26151_20650 [Agromyces marinus]
MSDAAAIPRDPGLQPERTALSWTRTSFAVAVNALLLLREGLVADRTSLVAASVVLFAGACVILAVGRRRRRALSSPGEPLAMPLPYAWLVVGATLLAGVTAIASMLAGDLAGIAT